MKQKTFLVPQLHASNKMSSTGNGVLCHLHLHYRISVKKFFPNFPERTYLRITMGGTLELYKYGVCEQFFFEKFVIYVWGS